MLGKNLRASSFDVCKIYAVRSLGASALSRQSYNLIRSTKQWSGKKLRIQDFLMLKMFPIPMEMGLRCALCVRISWFAQSATDVFALHALGDTHIYILLRSKVKNALKYSLG